MVNWQEAGKTWPLPIPMLCTYCVGWCGGSTTATATPSEKAACLGASSSARIWAPTACR